MSVYFTKEELNQLEPEHHFTEGSFPCRAVEIVRIKELLKSEREHQALTERCEKLERVKTAAIEFKNQMLNMYSFGVGTKVYELDEAIEAVEGK